MVGVQRMWGALSNGLGHITLNKTEAETIRAFILIERESYGFEKKKKKGKREWGQRKQKKKIGYFGFLSSLSYK